MKTRFDLHEVQLMLYFVKQGYQQVQIKGIQQETWLYHPKAQSFRFIRIVKGPYRETEDTMILQIHKTLQTILRTSGPVLNLHLDLSSYIVEGELELKTVGIDVLTGHNDEVLSVLPELSEVLVAVSDVDQAYDHAEKELASLIKKKQRMQSMKVFYQNLPVVSVALGVLSILVWLALLLLNRWLDNGQQITAAITLGAYYRVFVVANQEYWRLLTTGFVHIDFTHLVMNLLSLINVGIVVEKFYGRGKYALIVLGSIVMASVFAHLHSSAVMMLGLSGGVYGAFAALLTILVDTKAIQNPRVLRSIASVMLINIIISLLPGVSLIGHLGGFVGGLILSIVCLPGKDKVILRRNMVIATFGLLFFLGYQFTSLKQQFDYYVETDIAVIDTYYRLGLQDYAYDLLKSVDTYYAEVMQ